MAADLLPTTDVHRWTIATNAHPTHARLVIEVALTSTDRDLRVKPGIDARAVDEYWVPDDSR